ncbi:hypothetical protein TNCV_2304891 [Trichonephila clavipes]|nr:hypothetical protein TNCV_2304891 [Trichonephila clavipes]
MTFGDRPRRFEPWSGDEDDTELAPPLLTTTPTERTIASFLCASLMESFREVTTKEPSFNLEQKAAQRTLNSGEMTDGRRDRTIRSPD